MRRNAVLPLLCGVLLSLRLGAPALAVGGVKAIAESAEIATTPTPGLDKFDEERVRAAVTLALDAAMPLLIDEITAKVLLALKEY